MKTIVTHFNPDLDAITSTWALKKFMKGWEDAEIQFVAAGKTLNNLPPDKNPDIIHVDTGFGKFDHHNTDSDICATSLVWEYLKTHKDKLKGINSEAEIKSMDRLVAVVNGIDHFREVFWPNPDADYYDFDLERMIDGWKILYPDSHLRYMDWGMDCLDGILQTFKNKIWAEEEIQKGIKFETKWGNALGVETINDEVIHLGQKKGIVLIVRKDPRKGYLRIKTIPEPKNDLTEVYDYLKKLEPEATWFLHASKHMILNGSRKNPEHVPSKLSLKEVIEIITNFK